MTIDLQIGSKKNLIMLTENKVPQTTHTQKKKKHYGLLIWLWISDVLLIVGSYALAYAIRFAPGMPLSPGKHAPPFFIYLEILPFAVLVYFLALRFYGLYKLNRIRSLLEEFFLILKAVLVGSIILMASSFVYRDYSYSRTMFLIKAGFLILFLFTNRVLFHRIETKLARSKGFQRNILLCGHGPAIRQLINGLTDQKGSYAVVGLLANDKELIGTHINNVSVLGTLDDFERILEDHSIDEVILGETEMPRKRIFEMVLKSEEKMVNFRMVSDMLGMVTNKLDIENINGVSLLGITETPLNHPVNRFIKRFIDISISLVSVILLSPVLIITGLLVKLNDGGPIFYKQERVGEDGKIFNILKFRSMQVDAESKTGPKFADEDDPRKTPFGKFLRRTNLDELPQFFNVLLGDMSLVGPRPERPIFVNQLKTDIPRYMARHRVRSGITGWAQVNGLRGGPPSEERIKYDLYYIENWSVWLDLKILFMTPFAFKGAK